MITFFSSFGKEIRISRNALGKNTIVGSEHQCFSSKIRISDRSSHQGVTLHSLLDFKSHKRKVVKVQQIWFRTQRYHLRLLPVGHISVNDLSGHQPDFQPNWLVSRHPKYYLVSLLRIQIQYLTLFQSIIYQKCLLLVVSLWTTYLYVHNTQFLDVDVIIVLSERICSHLTEFQPGIEQEVLYTKEITWFLR